MDIAITVFRTGESVPTFVDRAGKAADGMREDLESLLHPRHCPPRDRRRHPRRPVRRM